MNAEQCARALVSCKELEARVAARYRSFQGEFLLPENVEKLQKKGKEESEEGNSDSPDNSKDTSNSIDEEVENTSDKID